MSAISSTAARRLMITAFGFNDSGGGTTVPRLASKELARRGWDVTVFHAAVPSIPGGHPYQLREWQEDGVRLIGVHNRAHGLFDFGNPYRELDDPPISKAFAAALDRLKPDVVHFHNLHNLGASLMDHVASRGLPSYFSTHNYWLIDPRAYLLDPDGSISQGPGDGSLRAAAVGSVDEDGYRRRFAEMRARAGRSLSAILAVSSSVRRTLLAAGYPPELVDVVRQAMPHEAEIWSQVGRDRVPGRVGDELTVAFLGSAYPHKGPQLLIKAAQQTKARIRIKILGEVPPQFAKQLSQLDRRGVVKITGAFEPSEIGSLLEQLDAVALPSLWWDCAPLAAAECLAARTPLIVPRLGGLPESIRDEVDGLTFNGLDADDLARQLDRLALEPGLLERLQGAIRAPRPFADYVDELEAYYAGERRGQVDDRHRIAAPAVRWQGDHGLPTSLSIINDRVTERLTGPVQRVARDGRAVDSPLAHAAEVEVRHQWPPDLRAPASGRLAVIQPWEFGAIPKAWLPQIDANVDELWVPSEYVRQMYVAGGIDPERVVTIPNGVDLDVFRPAGAHEPDRGDHTRFLFVGGLIGRKGPDVLLDAWRRAFADRDDVTLVVKDFGATSVYRTSDRGPIREYAASGRLPKVQLLDAELSTEELADLYRSCDVLVHPYRGEGFGMPVLEAMACGLPVIVTGGGPTDEFCPADAGWRIDSTRKELAAERIDALETAGRPYLLEPDTDHLAELMRAVAASREERRRRGAAAHAAAQSLSWEAVSNRYRERISALATRRPMQGRRRNEEPFALAEQVELRVLATPAWRGNDSLGELLLEWTRNTARDTSACLYLLADPGVGGEPAELEARVLGAAKASGAEIDSGADINVLMEPLRADLDERLHAAVDVYVPLHAACAGHERLARAAGNEIVHAGTGELPALLATRAPSLARAA